ncbi:polyphosphate kinase 2 family protein [Clostridia bacterium]|nr:polyphosphate kinase 2 family protein [Clostridia bacterium]
MIEKFTINRFDRNISTSDFKAAETLGLSKKEVKKEYRILKDKFSELQEVLFASKKYALLIVLQGIDCSGKDGTVKKVLSGINPNGFRVASFKEPTPLELGHDYLWRVHQKTPKLGDIVIFNRSYYEDVLVTRVHGTIDDETAYKRFEEIRSFERYLTSNDTIVLKFFLHISPEFQREKLQERLEEKDKNWKFSESDLEERKHWDRYQQCYSDMLAHCATEYAPWYVVPANHRWFRDYLILSVIVNTLERLPFKYPELQTNVQKLIEEVKSMS